VTKDILGKALEDYIKGKRNKTFIHRDDGFVDREPIERYFKTYADWSRVERKLIDDRIKGSILETGCGIGEHLIYLQKKGFDASGVDISPKAIEIAKEQGVRNCYVMDARNMKFNKKFDKVLMLYYGFGLGGTFEGQIKLLNHIYALTKDKGQIIASSIDALKTDNPRHIAYQDHNKRKNKDYGDVTQVTLRLEHDGEFGEWYDLLFVNPKGLHELVAKTNWKIDEILPEKKGGRAWYYILTK
jgi:SAM-dependent methyltransferase